MNTCGICKTSLESVDTWVVEAKFLKTGRTEVVHLCLDCVPKFTESFEGDSTWMLSLESYLSHIERHKELASL